MNSLPLTPGHNLMLLFKSGKMQAWPHSPQFHTKRVGVLWFCCVFVVPILILKKDRVYYTVGTKWWSNQKSTTQLLVKGRKDGGGSLEVRKSLGTLMSTLGEVVLAAPRKWTNKNWKSNNINTEQKWADLIWAFLRYWKLPLLWPEPGGKNKFQLWWSMMPATKLACGPSH